MSKQELPPQLESLLQKAQLVGSDQEAAIRAQIEKINQAKKDAAEHAASIKAHS